MCHQVVLAPEDRCFLVRGAQMEARTLFCPARPISLMQTNFQDWMWSSVSLSEVERGVSHIVFLISRFGNFEYLAESWWKDCRVSCGCQSVF